MRMAFMWLPVYSLLHTYLELKSESPDPPVVHVMDQPAMNNVTLDSNQRYDLYTVSPLLDHELIPKNTPEHARHCSIRYSPNMTYHGEIHYCKPHGFGTLKEENRTSIGWWILGEFQTGIIMELVELPEILREQITIPQIKTAILIVKNKTCSVF